MPNNYRSMQGNMGLGKAIQYFTSQEIPIAIPLNDTQKYDLIADFDGKLQRISVKTSCFSAYNNSYSVNLKSTGGASGKSNISNFDNNSCDYIFIYTADENIYLIPSNKISAKTQISVGNLYTEYLVKCKNLQEYKEENYTHP